MFTITEVNSKGDLYYHDTLMVTLSQSTENIGKYRSQITYTKGRRRE